MINDPRHSRSFEMGSNERNVVLCCIARSACAALWYGRGGDDETILRRYPKSMRRRFRGSQVKKKANRLIETPIQPREKRGRHLYDSITRVLWPWVTGSSN